MKGSENKKTKMSKQKREYMEGGKKGEKGDGQRRMKANGWMDG